MPKISTARSFIVELIIIACTLVPSMAHSAIRRVPAAYATIQAAIDAASPGDEVVIANGIYDGSGNTDLNFHGKAITVRSADSSHGVIIDVQDQPGHRGVCFQNGETSASVLQGITIQNGNAHFGGGILITNGSSPTIIDCIIRNNTARQGGGVEISGAGSSPILRHVVISGNTAMTTLNHQGGGGLQAVGTAGNTTVTVIGCRIVGNTSYGTGGGILISRATLKISGTTISHNTTTIDPFRGEGGFSGGGIAVSGLPGQAPQGNGGANALIYNCIISDNSAWEKGGALLFEHVAPANALEVVNTLIYGNESSACVPPDGFGNAAAVDAWQASPSFVNDTITNNRELSGLSVICARTDGRSALTAFPAHLHFANCIIYDNSAGQVGDTTGNHASIDIAYSDVDDPNYPAGIKGNIDADPLFADPINDDFHLRSNSPAIDAGNNAALPPDLLDLNHNGNTTEPVPVDLDGSPRCYSLTGARDKGKGAAPLVDMGAYEAGRSVLRLDKGSYSVPKQMDPSPSRSGAPAAATEP